tara:strand:- start:7206 stop:8327 length:1122 start_codon:yes stop_codon:yes gene_type:complete
MRSGIDTFDDLRRRFVAFANQSDSAATTIPPQSYALPEVLDLETSTIFEKEWICLGRQEEIPQPGDYFTSELAGEPLLVVRGDDGTIRVLSNICRHKWTQVAQGKGNAKLFVCPYHAWSYGRNGRLVNARYMDRTEGFVKEECALPELRCELWHGFIFVNLDPDAVPLAEKLNNLEPLVAGHRMAEMSLFTGEDEVWACNWKILVENFTEGYHTFQTHAKSLQNATPTDLTYWGHDDPAFSAFYSPTGPDEVVREPHSPDLDETQRKTVLMICSFPSHVMALAPDRVFYMCITPQGVGHVRTKWGVASYGEEFSNDNRENIARFYRQVNEEDRVTLERIQQGVGSRFARPGRMSWLETTNMHFGRYIARKLAA